MHLRQMQQFSVPVFLFYYTCKLPKLYLSKPHIFPVFILPYFVLQIRHKLFSTAIFMTRELYVITLCLLLH